MTQATSTSVFDYIDHESFNFMDLISILQTAYQTYFQPKRHKIAISTITCIRQ